MSTTTWNISTFSLSAFLLGSPFRLHRDAPPAAAVLMFWKCTFQHAFSGSICQTAAKPSFNQNDIIVLLRRPSKIVIKCLVEPWSCNPPAGTRFCCERGREFSDCFKSAWKLFGKGVQEQRELLVTAPGPSRPGAPEFPGVQWVRRND